MKNWKWIVFLFLGAAAFLLTTMVIFDKLEPEFIYSPSEAKIINSEQHPIASVQSGDDYSPETLELGKKMFYEETFGNEVFFTDIMGLFDGPITIPNMVKVIVKLGGKGTENLQVELAESFTVGDQTFQKGELFDTGLDVPKGAFSPLGVKVKFADGRLKAGLSCALCHATVDRDTGMILQGISNSNLNMGLLLAMGTNTSAYFTHSEIKSLEDYLSDSGGKIKDSNGNIVRLPDHQALEEAVDQHIAHWPKGSLDTTIDFVSSPVQIPDTFTLGDHPYGWSGQGIIGPYQGLSAAINNAHAQNTDALSQAEISGPVFGIDKEVYVGTILQHAATPKYRYKPSLEKKPSEFFAKVDPTPSAIGSNHLYPTPFYPKISYVSSVGLFQGTSKYTAWEQVKAMSAWMNTLLVPKPVIEVNQEAVKRGREIFEKASCVACHAGDYLTNNAIIPIEEIGTHPARAKGLQGTQRWFAEPSIWKEGTPIPIPPDAKSEKVAILEDQRKQLQLAWAHGTQGGYKVPSLLGIYWSAPYLHDGGVSVGKKADRELGIPGTLHAGIEPDPFQSMRALLDRQLRQSVIEANRGMKNLKGVTGEGHAYWVDSESGFTKEDQEHLISYLFSLQDPGRKRSSRK